MATALRGLGFSVWFDASLSAGDAFSDEIDREVRAAKVIIVCWSPAAATSQWVKAEAQVGFSKGNLVSTYVNGPDAFDAPVPFNSVHMEDLRGWAQRPSSRDPAWLSVLRRLGSLSGRLDVAEWGALGPDASLGQVQSWFAAHGAASPLVLEAENFVRELEVAGRERASAEAAARERFARLEAEKTAAETAAREASAQARASEAEAREAQAVQGVSAFRNAVAFWEPSRVTYNVLLVASLVLTFVLTNSRNPSANALGVILSFLVGANVCYSACYLVDPPLQRWLRGDMKWPRLLAWGGGTVFSIWVMVISTLESFRYLG